MPRPEVQFAWESRSMRRTRWPRRARAWERFMAVVVLPTPPFWFAMAMTFTWGGGWREIGIFKWKTFPGVWGGIIYCWI